MGRMEVVTMRWAREKLWSISREESQGVRRKWGSRRTVVMFLWLRLELNWVRGTHLGEWGLWIVRASQALRLGWGYVERGQHWDETFAACNSKLVGERILSYGNTIVDVRLTKASSAFNTIVRTFQYRRVRRPVSSIIQNWPGSPKIFWFSNLPEH